MTHIQEKSFDLQIFALQILVQHALAQLPIDLSKCKRPIIVNSNEYDTTQVQTWLNNLVDGIQVIREAEVSQRDRS